MQMDPKRIVLMIVFTFSVVMLWENWTRYTAPKVPVAVAGQSAAAAGLPTPMASSPQADKAAAVPSGEAPVGAAVVDYASAGKAVVKTDLVRAEISAIGGDVTRLEILKHQATDDPKSNFVVLEYKGKHTYLAQSGLLGAGLPTHKTVYQLQAGDYVLKDGEDKLQVRLNAPIANGISVAKVLTFHRGSYLVDVAYEIDNLSTAAVAATAYFQFERDGEAAETTTGMMGGVSTFTGPAFYTEEKHFQKVEFKAIEKQDTKFQKEAKDGWVAMVQHYFVSAYLPKGDAQREFYARKNEVNGLFDAGVKLPVSAAAGSKSVIEVPLYVGPQEQKKLEAIAPGFDLVVDYGWVAMLAKPIFWLLSKVHDYLGNWGWAIIVVTIMIKAAFFPLSAASYKSMAKMKKLMPRMKQLQERYADDKMKLNQAMMEMYKTEKVNPMGGCLPIAVQIPVFIALYWTLLGVVEMRQAPWLGWITDLSAKDPYYILPLIMGATMLIQTKLNPTPPDPMQAKVMLAMPIVFTFMFLWFPSGLVLYWVLNNVLSIAQQWYITRMIDSGSGKSA